MAKAAAQMVEEANAAIETLSPTKASNEVSAGDTVLVDVREPVEWEHHIPGAVQIPRGLLEFAADPSSPKHNEALDPTRRVLVYCRSGTRAALAASTLKMMGYERVANLDGGITAWRDAGLPTTEHHAGI